MTFNRSSTCRMIAIGLMWIMVGCGGAFLIELWWRSSDPHLIQVYSAEVSPVRGDGGYSLLVTAAGPPARDCLRFTQHALYRDQKDIPSEVVAHVPWLQRNYVPLAAAVNGVGFNSVRDFTVQLYIPPSIPPGKWNYVIRSVYWCTVFPGFTKFIESTNVPVVIDLSETVPPK